MLTTGISTGRRSDGLSQLSLGELSLHERISDNFARCDENTLRLGLLVELEHFVEEGPDLLCCEDHLVLALRLRLATTLLTFLGVLSCLEVPCDGGLEDGSSDSPAAAGGCFLLRLLSVADAAGARRSRVNTIVPEHKKERAWLTTAESLATASQPRDRSVERSSRGTAACCSS